MAEVRIKIQSDPYQEKVRYYSWHGYWREITTSTNPGSGLLGERLVRGFFPFKAEEIVETISKEFGDGGRIQLVFEGSDDEWRELKIHLLRWPVRGFVRRGAERTIPGQRT